MQTRGSATKVSWIQFNLIGHGRNFTFHLRLAYAAKVIPKQEMFKQFFIVRFLLAKNFVLVEDKNPSLQQTMKRKNREY